MADYDKIKILIIAHPNRDTGGLSVASNYLSCFKEHCEQYEFLATLPCGCGYEKYVQGTPIRVVWFRQDNSYLRRLSFDVFTLKKIKEKFQPHAVICMGHMGYPWIGGKQFVRFADPHFVYPPKHYGVLSARQRARYVFQRIQFRRTLMTARAVYCQTETMAKRLVDQYPVKTRVEILPNSLPALSGRTENIDPPLSVQEYADKFRLICLTRYNPHKNLERIVETFDRFREKLSGVVVFLTIRHDQHPAARKLLQSIVRKKLQNHIINIGPIPQQDIGSYFEHCHGLLFPTLLESFSASYLESMHFRLPIITSDLDFAHEVCRDAALYCDPWAAASIADSIMRLQSDHQLQADLKEKGSVRLRQFQTDRWAQNAARLLTDIKNTVQPQNTSTTG